MKDLLVYIMFMITYLNFFVEKDKISKLINETVEKCIDSLAL